MMMMIFILAITTLSAAQAALQPAAPRPATHYPSASAIPDPPPVVDPFEPTMFDNALLSVFRFTLQQQSKGPRSELPGFEGMVEELMDFRRMYGLDEQERVSYQTMIALSGPVPFLYRHLFSKSEYSPEILAWFAKHIFPFLVGDMELTQRSEDDHRPGGVYAERCRVLEGTNCVGVCSRMCKLPTERFFKEEWGVPLSMTPNLETGECQLAFGVEPIPIEDDPTIPNGCLSRCPAATGILRKNRKQDSEQSSKEFRTIDGC